MTTSMDDLLRVLREQAATFEDSIDADWGIEATSSSVRVTAATREMTPDPDTAWETAKGLRDAIVRLGHEPYGPCTIGVMAETGFKEDESGDGPPSPIVGWRGSILLIFATPA
jgi:hypothetical protein